MMTSEKTSSEVNSQHPFPSSPTDTPSVDLEQTLQQEKEKVPHPNDFDNLDDNDYLHETHESHNGKHPGNEDPEALTRVETTLSGVEPPESLWREGIFVGVVCMAQFMTQTGLSLSIPPVYIIGRSFNISNPGELSWFSAAYSLTVGTFILFFGRLGDIYGHKLIFLIGFFWYGLWSLLGGFSVWSNQIFFDFCRAFQGIGPAMLLPNALAIFGRAYQPGLRKQMVFSLFGATAPSGFIVGGTFGSLLAQRVWWPWAYWILAVACFLFMALGYFVIPHTPRPKFRDNDSLSPWVRLDALGAVAGVSGLILINFAWNQAALVGWQNPYTYVILIIGFIVLGIFGYIERNAKCPLLPRSVFTGDLAWVLSCIAAGWSSFGIIIYYYYQFMLVIKGDTPLLVTAKFAGATVSGAIAALATGFLLSHVSPSIIMFCSMFAFTAGLSIFATVPLGQTFWAQAFVITLIMPWGM